MSNEKKLEDQMKDIIGSAGKDPSAALSATMAVLLVKLDERLKAVEKAISKVETDNLVRDHNARSRDKRLSHLEKSEKDMVEFVRFYEANLTVVNENWKTLQSLQKETNNG